MLCDCNNFYALDYYINKLRMIFPKIKIKNPKVLKKKLSFYHDYNLKNFIM